MLNKSAEKVLKVAIQKSQNNLNKKIVITSTDFKNSLFSNIYINSICEELAREGLIYKLLIDYEGRYGPTFFLKHEGFSYFDKKKKERQLLMLKSAWLPFTVSLLTTLTTYYILPMLPQIIKWFYDALSKTL